MEKFNSFADFESASRGVLAFLHKRLGFGLWMVTRTEGDDWIVLQSEDHGYGVKDGAVFRWADSFCSQMVQGRGPCIAPKSIDIPAYANAPIGRQVNIGAYVGVPISDADGSLFGTLCAIDPQTQPESLHGELPLIELFGRLLSCLLASELKAISSQRRAEKNYTRTSMDHQTGLMNLAGWENVLEAEERRCRVYGHSACIVSIRIGNEDQDESSLDANIIATSKALKGCLGPNDSVARVAPNLFLMMGAERNREQASDLVLAIQTAMTETGIPYGMGHANREPTNGLKAALKNALDKAVV